jgi:DNA-binding NtrC family response regulator
MEDSKPQARILIVDDEKDIADVIKQGLESNGFEAIAYSDSSQALEHFRQNSKAYCAVLSDVRMPQVTGFQLAREIKKINPEVKVVLMSAFEISQELSDDSPSTKADDFIAKPARIINIKNVLLKHIGETKLVKGGDGENGS